MAYYAARYILFVVQDASYRIFLCKKTHPQEWRSFIGDVV